MFTPATAAKGPHFYGADASQPQNSALLTPTASAVSNSGIYITHIENNSSGSSKTVKWITNALGYLKQLWDSLWFNVRSHLRMITAAELNNFDNAKLQSLNVSVLNRLPSNERSQLAARVLNNLSDKQLKHLNVSVLNGLSFIQLWNLESSLLNSLSDKQLKHLKASVLKGLSERQLSKLKASVLNGLSQEQFKKLDYLVIRTISNRESSSPSLKNLRSFHREILINSRTDTKLIEITDKQIQSMSHEKLLGRSVEARTELDFDYHNFHSLNKTHD